MHRMNRARSDGLVWHTYNNKGTGVDISERKSGTKQTKKHEGMSALDEMHTKPPYSFFTARVRNWYYNTIKTLHGFSPSKDNPG